MISYKISFVVPVYNVEKYLSRCIESIINQKYKNIEVILVDDGSKDSSGQICDNWAYEDNRIKVIHKQNGGLSSARNVGTNVATGEFICYVDSDDWIDNDLTFDFINSISEADDVFVYGHRMVTCEKDKYAIDSFSYKTIDGLTALNYFVANQINGYAVNKIVRRSLILDNRIMFPEGRNYEDIATTYKYFMYANNVKITGKKYYNYFVNNSSSITNRDSYKNLNDFYLSCEDMYYGILEYYRTREISTTMLQCFRINLYTQLFIRLEYFLINSNSVNSKDVYNLQKKVRKILDNEKVSMRQMKKFVNYKKYFLYKVHLLPLVLKVKAKKARGY